MQNVKDSPETIFNDIREVRRRLCEESEPGCALIGAALLDDSLEVLLRASFVDKPHIAERLLGVDRPLGTFSSRIDAAYCLGLIDTSDQRELHVIRKVRNHFAHQRRKASFSEPPIADFCRGLGKGNQQNPKVEFIATVLVLSGLLLLRAIEARRHDFKQNYPGPVGEEAMSKLRAVVSGN